MIVQREFVHTPTGILLFLVYVGDGVEGWPDVAHGGVITTLLKEAIERCANNYINAEPGRKAELESINVNFLEKVQPGVIYAVQVTPGIFDGTDYGDNIREAATAEEAGISPEDANGPLIKSSTRLVDAAFLDTETLPNTPQDQGPFVVHAIARGRLSHRIHSFILNNGSDIKPI